MHRFNYENMRSTHRYSFFIANEHYIIPFCGSDGYPAHQLGQIEIK